MEKAQGKERQNPVENNDELGRTTTVRIFVGGLGESVTAADIMKTFSSLGEIKDLDIIRTKGRSFAYMEYLPASETALSKLFSMYNGCAWKGGRLKLERAKEHYLARMRREWSEDAKLASSPPSNDIDVDKQLCSLEEPKKFQKPEKKEIRIFIPKLGKVKSLPFYGSGKHKYSFQRVEVPALPSHFCDCEEHSDSSSYAVNAKRFPEFQMQSGGMNEEEVAIMNAVMKKLSERKRNVNAASVETTLAEQADGLAEQADDSMESVPDENEANPDDLDDNLITNIVAGGNDRTTLETLLRKQESRSTQLQTLTDKKAKNKHSVQEGRSTHPNKKRKFVTAEANDGNGMTASIPENKLQTPTNKKAKNKHIVEERNSTPNKKRKTVPAEANDGNGMAASIPKNKLRSQAAEPESNVQQSSHSRFPKSLWKELVDTSGTNQFSVSHVLQGSPTEENQHKIDGSNVLEATESKPTSDAEHETLNLRSKDLAKPEVQSAKPDVVESKSKRGFTSRQRETLKIQPKEVAPPEVRSVRPNGVENKSARAIDSGQPEALKTLHSKEMSRPEVVPSTKPDVVVNKSASGTASKQHKFSWKQLIQDGNDSSFSIAQIVPGISNHDKEEVAKTDFANARLELNRNVSFGDPFKGFGLGNDGSLAAPRSSKLADGLVRRRKNLSSRNSRQSNMEHTKDSAPSVTKKCGSAAAGKQAFPDGSGGIGETCMFMRSAASMKEWATTKAALTKSFKKKIPK